ncbi:15467_t:CDS:1 [Funneliformis geosporum]|uniref:15467_t:CDS:1 n=1 Tax=Funneliformis geosporum TaxID=1117311 RepID=A0A9W4SUP6_9GLOM|nr:15467_t:CDS:1 [Funneliformis geosporum]
MSRIDYIWSSVDIVSNLLHCFTTEVSSQLSDHLIVSFKIDNFLEIKHTNRKISLKKVYDFDKMTPDKWTIYGDKVDALTNGCELTTLTHQTVFTQNRLNCDWDLLQAYY